MGNTKIITLGNLKGGVGKTTVTLNVAAILAENGFKVLAMDCDAQANMTHRLGVTTKQVRMSTKDIFESATTNLKDVIIPSPIAQLPNLDLVPSNFFLAVTESSFLPNATLREFILANYFETYKEVINKYNYVLLDTNPSFGIVNLNAYLVSDAIVLVNEPGIDSLDGSLIVMEKWNEILNNLSSTMRMQYPNNICGFLINRYDGRTNASKQFVEFCRTTEGVKELLFETVIPINSALADSMNDNKPINIHKKSSSGYKALFNFTNELLGRLGHQKIVFNVGRPKKSGKEVE